ncbi:hypothetical protein BH24BAC1_BH24BAC1_36560 [soil metagenome]
MYLFNLDQAVVEDRKIRDYLLNVQHPDGGSKARFFLKVGFSPDRLVDFRLFLIRHAKEHPVARIEKTAFGTKYIIEGKAEGPNQYSFDLRTVWMAPNAPSFPLLITAYPLTS